MFTNKKIIAFDLDGTLAVSKCPITAPVAESLKKILEYKKIVIISGGNFEQFKNQFLPLFGGEDVLPWIHNLILLPVSGTQKYEYDEAKKYWDCKVSIPLEKDIKEKTISLLQTIIKSPDWGIPPNPKGEIIEDRTTQISFSALGQLAPIEEKKLWDPNQEKRQKIKSYLESQIPNINISIGGTTTLDILPAGINKAAGLCQLLEDLKMQKSDMLFVGDGIFLGGNDYSVKEAGIDTVLVKGPEETAPILEDWISEIKSSVI